MYTADTTITILITIIIEFIHFKPQKVAIRLFGAKRARSSSCVITISSIIIIIRTGIIIIIRSGIIIIIRIIIRTGTITNSRIRTVTNSRIRTITKSGTITGVVVTIRAVIARCIITTTCSSSCYWWDNNYNDNYNHPKDNRNNVEDQSNTSFTFSSFHITSLFMVTSLNTCYCWNSLVDLTNIW